MGEAGGGKPTRKIPRETAAMAGRQPTADQLSAAARPTPTPASRRRSGQRAKTHRDVTGEASPGPTRGRCCAAAAADWPCESSGPRRDRPECADGYLQETGNAGNLWADGSASRPTRSLAHMVALHPQLLPFFLKIFSFSLCRCRGTPIWGLEFSMKRRDPLCSTTEKPKAADSASDQAFSFHHSCSRLTEKDLDQRSRTEWHKI